MLASNRSPLVEGRRERTEWVFQRRGRAERTRGILRLVEKVAASMKTSSKQSFRSCVTLKLGSFTSSRIIRDLETPDAHESHCIALSSPRPSGYVLRVLGS